jgi:hypothetical protein
MARRRALSISAKNNWGNITHIIKTRKILVSFQKTVSVQLVVMPAQWNKIHVSLITV